MGGGGGFGGADPGVGRNPPAGIVAHFYLKEKPAGAVKLEVLDSAGTVIRTFASDAGRGGDRLDVVAGMNRFVWNLRYPDASRFDGMIFWAGGIQGPTAPPGTYQVRLTAGDWSETRSATLLKDPRVSATRADLDAQFRLLIRIRDRVTRANDAVTKIRAVRRDLDGALERLRTVGSAVPKASADSVRALAKTITDELTAAEEAIYQTKNRSNQDPLNYPIRLNNKIAALAGVVGGADAKPTEQAYAVFEELSAALQVQLDRVDAVLRDRIPAFNAAVGGLNLPAVVVN
jgi:hypothetical protein